MIAYYAHAINIYNTPAEARDVDTISQLGFDVLNPNALKHDVGYKAQGFGYFLGLVDTVDCVVFKALPDGSISSGVALEIQHAIARHIPVIEIPSSIGRRTLDKAATRAYLEEVGYR
jgi:hypothetical protein